MRSPTAVDTSRASCQRQALMPVTSLSEPPTSIQPAIVPGAVAFDSVPGNNNSKGPVVCVSKTHPKESVMKTATLAATLLLLGTGLSFAGAGAPVPEGSQTPPPSGRPSAALDDAKCETVWKMASPNGDT